MSSKRKTYLRQAAGRVPHGDPAPGVAGRSGALKSKVLLTVGAILQAAARYADAAPPLPTPCAPCGVNAASLPFVQSGVAGASISGNSLQVTQSSNAAILNWQDFNIAKGNSVNFKQPSATAATLNRIWSADPSTIAGKLTANGQVYLVNQNGIVFANGAQVNVGGLVASTLDIADSTFLNGLLSVNTPALTGSGSLAPVFQAGPGGAKSISVEAGATLTTADGGRVMLLGTTVNNQGSISTPDGQTILGAGTTVYLASTTDPKMRGLLIAVDGQQLPANSTVTNTGTISAARGNVTLAGLVVNQAGNISATTSVNANGSIYLLAGNANGSADQPAFYADSALGESQGQMLPNEGGTLTLAAGSVTQIRPDSGDQGTITDSQVFNTSQLSLVGKTVDVQGGASIVAPGAAMIVTAAADPFDHVRKENIGQIPVDADGSRIYLEAGSTIDLSGLEDVPISAGRNLLTIQLDANALQDDPLLRNGFLHGQTVTVDVARGTPLLNQATLQAYGSTIARGIDEKLTPGGTIAMSSGGDIITRAGSIQNVSGGSIAYQQSAGATSKLLGADGKVYDISSAPNNIQYTALADSYSYTDSRWGVTSSWGQKGGMIPAYQQGANAGAISVEAPQIYLRGSMQATTTPGPYQRGANTLPLGGSFQLGNGSAKPSGVAQLVNQDAPSILLVDGAIDDLGAFDPTDATALLPAKDQGTTELSLANLGNSGINRIALFSNGVITLPAGTQAILPGNGTLTLNAGTVSIGGTVRAPGSTVSVTTTSNLAQTNLAQPTLPPPDVSQGDPTPPAPVDNNIIVGANAVIDVAGTWVNDSPLVTTQLGTAPTLYNGGSVTLQTAGVTLAVNPAHNDIVLDQGSVIDVSGGGWINSQNKLTAGLGGSINLKAGSVSGFVATGGVDLGGTLRGESLTSGGSLAITSAWASIAGDVSGQQGQLSLSADFFTLGGFGKYSITGVNGVTIGSGNPAVTTAIRPEQQNLVFSENMLLRPTGSTLSDFTQLETLPDDQRSPVSVSFASTASGRGNPGLGNVTLNGGVSIITDPGATVALTARENLTVLGEIDAPAGNINLQVAPGLAAVGSTDDDGYVQSQQLLIGGGARLLATGYDAIYTDNVLGYRLGKVLSGGEITLAAYKGSVVAQSGSLMDVSGASGVVDIVNTAGVTPTTVSGAAGSIDIEARENLVLNGTLKGTAAAVTGAAGGSLTIGLDLFDLTVTNGYNVPGASSGTAFPTNDRNLTLSGAATPGDSLPVDQDGNALDGVGRVSTSTIAAGGFDNVTLRSADSVTLDGAVSLTTKSSVTIDALELTATAGTRATLSSAYVALGDSQYYPTGSGESARAYAPVAGDAILVAKAGLIDFRGRSTLDGFGAATFNSTGDIRFTFGEDSTGATDFAGSLQSAANLTLIGAQLYPTTATHFTINPTDVPNGTATPADPSQAASYDYIPGSVGIFSNSAATTVPLSALGSLTINAPDIEQAGVVRAPFGQIALNGVGAAGAVTLHPGSLTSVSAEGQVIPYGTTQNATQWTYPVDIATQATSLIDALADRKVTLNGNQVAIDSNAKVDLSGGGDLYAYEFIAGTGGSHDVLSATGGSYSYAILPSLHSQYAPIDYLYDAGTDIAAGKQIYLSGVPGIAAGYYTLLPARYALLPGAYGVQLTGASSDILAGSAVKQPDGSYLAAGRFAAAGTATIDSRTSTFLVAPSSVVRNQAQYEDSYANTFFNAAAIAGKTVPVNLPADAGQLELLSSGTLRLDGTIGFAPSQFVSGKDANGNNIMTQGRGGIASIEAPQIEVVSSDATPDGSLQLTASSLNQLGAATLILGAGASAGPTGENLSVSATSVKLENGAADSLQAPEIILAATGQVELAAGSSIKSNGSGPGSAAAWSVAGDGALLRVSSGQQAPVLRTNLPATPLGILTIAAGATVSATSLALDGAADTQVDSGANISAQALEASSSRISLGEVPAGAAGLNVTAQLLGNFAGLTDLSLHSDSTIDFYGAVHLGALDPSTGQPLLQSVTLDSRGIAGYGSGDKSVQAGVITVSNVGGTQASAPFTTAPDGTGSLTLAALATAQAGSGQLNLGTGAKDIQGFGATTLAAAGDIRGQQTGSVTLTQAGTLALQSARISMDAGAEQDIANVSGSVAITTTTRVGAAPDAGLGGKLTISGTALAGQSAITQNGSIDLQGGVVSLAAHGGGDLVLGGGSQIIATGAAKPYADTYAAVAGGSVSLSSDQGNVILASGSTVDVSGVTAADGTTSGDAGSLAVFVPQGQLTLGGTIRGAAASGQQQGNFTLDTAGNADHGLPFDIAALNLSAAGFQGALSIRDRNDSAVVVSGTVRAASFELAADRGGLSVAGTIDTSGTSANANGGAISLWSAGDLTLRGGATLNSSALKPASGASARAGDITLGSTNGTITLASGATVNVKGQAGSDNVGTDPDGQLLLRARYNPDTATVNVNPLAATFVATTLPTVIVEGVRSYGSIGTIGNDGADLTYAMLGNDLQQFATNAPAIAAGLTPAGAGFVLEVRPGIDISSSGDLNVNSTLDLNALASNFANGAPVDLTLRAAGNLVLNGSISDGFVNSNAAVAKWTLGTAESGSLRLTAGADLTAADPLATQRGAGNFILTPGNLVRTGTGNIGIAAGNDVCLGCDPDDVVSTLTTAQAAVIYTAGRQSTNGPGFFGAPSIPSTDTAAAYPTGGGDIQIRAGGDVVSAPTTNLVSNWLWRQGSILANKQRNTSWWIEFSRFQQGVGTLGGGDVEVQAGGNISNLSVVAPTTGRVGSASATDNTLLASNLVVDGGGSLRVEAGGDISSGIFEADLGTALLSAGGAIRAAPGAAAPVLALIDSTFELRARTDVTIGYAFNTTALPESRLNISAIDRLASSYFYTYDPASAVDITSAGGSVLLSNDLVGILSAANFGTLLDANYKDSQSPLYPPNLNIAALSGDITLGVAAPTLLYPAANGNLNLLANGNVTLENSLQMLESDPAQMYTALRPTSLNVFSLPIPLPVVPLHQNDSQPARIVAATGDLDVGTVQMISLPKQAELVAGADIDNLSYSGKNLNPADVTLIEAGGSLLYSLGRDPATNQLNSNSNGIVIGGPGYAEVLTGGGIDLSNAAGVVTTGNLNDIRLPSNGATLVVAAGLGANPDGTLRAPAYDGFINDYLKPDASGNASPYAANVLAYMGKLYPDQGGQSAPQALADFLLLPRKLQLPLLAEVLSDELNATGLAHTSTGANYDRGYQAIARLFPTKDAAGQPLTYQGDINMFYSQLKTEQGGDINLLLPGGSVIVGVPNPAPNLSATKEDTIFNPPLPAEANLGLLVLASGAIRGFADGNFEVNQSRILTLQGGDIILWSSNGDIDAGKGARTAQGAPPPVVQTDAKGNIFVNPVGAVSGSGIGQLLTVPGITAGIVDLIAPKGTVNAGEAGIRAVNLNIAALQVLNVGNIKVSGTATGLPVSDAGAFAGALSGANALGDAGKTVADALSQTLAGNTFQQLTESLKPTFIVVKMFCLGIQCDTQ